MITLFIIKPKPVILGMLVSLGTALSAQPALDAYIEAALSNNLVLQQKNITLEKAKTSLDIARGYFLPTVSFQLGYQTADGGRDISLPLGDLLNHAYATLNQLTGTNNFPQLDNQKVNFLPKNFYDGKVRTTIPVLNSQIRYNRTISGQQVALSSYEIDIYKRELVKDVKTAYYNYLNALRAISVYEQASGLAHEGRRVNQKLLDNGKGLPAYVLRSDSEIENVNAQLEAARQQANNAAAYFNFLLNRDQQAAIDTQFDAAPVLGQVASLLAAEPQMTGREEVKALQQAVDIRETMVRMNKAAYQPSLNAFLDLGSQAEDWRFDKQSRYYMLGFQLEVPIFSGNRNKNKIRQSQQEAEQAKLVLSHGWMQLQLAGTTAKNNLKSAWKTYTASGKQLEAAASYQRLIDRGYREGINTFIETVDARNQYTQASILHLINEYKVLIAVATLERETAAYSIHKN